MEITDLQINDWVYDKSFTPSNFPCRIYSIEGRYPRRDKDFNDKPLIDVWVGDGFLTSHIENIEPIPLTTEILVKNGFAMEQERPCKIYRLWLGDCYEEGFVCIAYHNFDDGQHISLHIEAIPPHVLSTLTIEFTYVHELQHALRLCGLNELADNFKIE